MAFRNNSSQFELAVKDRANYSKDLYEFTVCDIKCCVMPVLGFNWEGYVKWPQNHQDRYQSKEFLNRIYPGVFNGISFNSNGIVGFTTMRDYCVAREIAGCDEGSKQYRSFEFVKRHVCDLAQRIRQRMVRTPSTTQSTPRDSSNPYLALLEMLLGGELNPTNNYGRQSDGRRSTASASATTNNSCPFGCCHHGSRPQNTTRVPPTNDQPSYRFSPAYGYSPVGFNTPTRNANVQTDAQRTNTRTTSSFQEASNAANPFEALIKDLKNMGFVEIPMDSLFTQSQRPSEPTEPSPRRFNLDAVGADVSDKIYDDMPDLMDDDDDSTSVSSNETDKDSQQPSDHVCSSHLPVYNADRTQASSQETPSCARNSAYPNMDQYLNNLDYDDIMSFEELYPNILQNLLKETSCTCPKCRS